MAFPLRLIAAAALCGAAVLMASCGNAAPSARVLAGNLAQGRGQYQRAILYYLAAEDEAVSGLDAVHYNLANVYYALGEGSAALKSWAQAESSTGETDTLFRIAFNRGVLYYNWGRYEEAYRSFRRALELNPSDIDAKINLEESLSRVRTEATHPGSAAEGTRQESSEGSSRLLDYVRRKEADAWSPESAQSENAKQDW